MKKAKKVKTSNLFVTSIIFLVIFFVSFWLIRYFFASDRYRYVNVALFPFWHVALCIGVLLGIPTYILLKKADADNKTCIGMFLVVCFLSFCMSNVAIAHLHHMLDDSEPVRHTAIIEEKRLGTGSRKGITSYKFTITVNEDTFEIKVPSDHYYALNEGDIYVIEYHNGAFNVPYYIGVGGETESKLQ